MDNHPIPQDVTGFQFKLIGNMTVKQFAYLVAGCVLAIIIFKLPNVNILIKFPFCTFFALFGLGLAYFPVSGRPMDLMIGNYIKALFRPTQFVYGKIGGQIYFPNKMPVTVPKNVKQYKNEFKPFPEDKLKTYLATLNPKPKNTADEKENNFLVSFSSLSESNSSYQPTATQKLNIPQQPAPQPTLMTYNLASNAPAPKEVSPSATPTAQQEPPATAPTVKLATNIAQPNINPRLLQTTTTAQQPPPNNPIADMPLAPKTNKTAGSPSIPTAPNLITGVTRDPRGNALPNILVEIKDKDGNPIRAFKTNGLGRFASATPLANGTYAVEFEDPKSQNKFGKLTVNVAGQIIMPIEAVSVDAREELRMSLFSNNNQAN